MQAGLGFLQVKSAELGDAMFSLAGGGCSHLVKIMTDSSAATEVKLNALGSQACQT
jgi:hypothetical protein